MESNHRNARTKKRKRGIGRPFVEHFMQVEYGVMLPSTVGSGRLKAIGV
jgi:hypothetical protein